MLVRSGLSGKGCEQFQTHAPQWTHFSRSKFGTPTSPSVMAWPEQILGGKPRGTQPLRARRPGLPDLRWVVDDWPAARVVFPGRFFGGMLSAAGDFGAVCS
jgi:hypothetical protein